MAATANWWKGRNVEIMTLAQISNHNIWNIKQILIKFVSDNGETWYQELKKSLINGKKSSASILVSDVPRDENGHPYPIDKIASYVSIDPRFNKMTVTFEKNPDPSMDELYILSINMGS